MATERSEPSRHWHCLDSEAAAALLDSDPDTGLSAQAAAARLEQAGPNVLRTRRDEHRTEMTFS